MSATARALRFALAAAAIIALAVGLAAAWRSGPATESEMERLARLERELAAARSDLSRLERALDDLRARGATAPAASAAPAPPAEVLRRAQAELSAVARRVQPAVVAIHGLAARGGSPELDEFMRRFGLPPQLQVAASGVIIEPDGYLLTNEHVIRDVPPEGLRVRLDDGRELPAKLCGADRRSDLALLKVEADGPLPTVAWGDSEQLAVGQWALALGNPFRLANSFTLGVISGVRHSLPGELLPLLLQLEADRPFHGGLIQTDAAINPGNSGGPLVDLEGRLIGINVCILSQTGHFEGVGFAVPERTLRHHLPFLRAGQPVEYGYLGAQLAEPETEELARLRRAGRAGGARLTGLAPKGPAAAAGLKAGQLVTAFDGKPTPTVGELITRVSLAEVGREVALEILDGETLREVKVRVARRPEPEALRKLAGDAEGPEAE